LLSLLQREGEHKHQQWRKNMSQEELERMLTTVRDDNLKLALTYGIGMHHAGLQHFERSLVEKVGKLAWN
jgi:activating signal cointegrator complex subunit 3